MNIKIKEKQTTDIFGNVKSTAVSVNMSIEYKVGNSTALGYYELLDPTGNVITVGNAQVSTLNWEENDDVIFDNFLSELGLERLGETEEN